MTVDQMIPLIVIGVVANLSITRLRIAFSHSGDPLEEKIEIQARKNTSFG
jgi:hypothetical protein